MDSELDELRNLIGQAEHTITFLINLVPQNEHAWLSWRLDKLKRKIRTAKHELGELINNVQAQAVHEHNAQRHSKSKVVGNLVTDLEKRGNS